MSVSEPVILALGEHDLPTVLVWHSPGGFPFEVDGLAPMADAAGVRVVGLEREALPSADGGPLLSVVSEAIELLDAHLPDKFTVLGWSGGAPFAWGAAVVAPDRVERVVVAAPLVGWLRGDGAIEAVTERLEVIRSGAVPEPMRRHLAVVAEPWGFDLEDVEVPTVVWYGGLDVVIPPTLVEGRLASLPTTQLRLFPDEQHFLPMGRWDQLLRLAAGI
jgi:pimeloyl-ACP methyl ester carboxylesterase